MSAKTRTTSVRVIEGSTIRQSVARRDQCASSPPTNGGFAFIHSSHPDDSRRRNSQTAIRRHVMRDIGKSRRRKRRPIIIPLAVSTADPRREHHDHMYVQAGNPSPVDFATAISSVPVERPDRSLGPLGDFVVEIDFRVRELLQFSKS